MEKLQTPGELFVAKYPELFTQDVELWTQILDEHFRREKDRLTEFFTKKVIIQKELSVERAILFCVEQGYIDADNVEKTVSEIFDSYIKQNKLK